MTEMFVKSYNNDKENLTDMLDTLNFWLPAKDVKITGGKLTGDTAVLDVEGVLASGVKALTLVRLIRGPSAGSSTAPRWPACSLVEKRPFTSCSSSFPCRPSSHRLPSQG